MAFASKELDEFRRALLQRKEELALEIEDGARRRIEEEDAYRTPPSDVGDAGDVSTATVQADLRHSQIERDIVELRAVDAALARLDDGTYGQCTRCGGDIGAARLRANPAAERCIACQTVHERQYAGGGTPSI